MEGGSQAFLMEQTLGGEKEGDRTVFTFLLEQLGAGWLTKMGRDRRRQQENSISGGGGTC